MISQEQARGIDARVDAGWETLKQAMTEMVETEGYKALGFGSFADWLATKEFRLEFLEQKKQLVCTLIELGASNTQISDSVYGVGDDTAQSVREQYEQGLPAEAVRFGCRRRSNVVEVDAHFREKPSPIDSTHIHLGTDYRECNAAARELGMTLPQLGRKLLVDFKNDHFKTAV